MGYSIVDFAKSLNLARCKIHNNPGLLFLCGGPIASNGPHRSARDYFYRYLSSKEPGIARRVKLAEEINAWFHKDDAFPDLLELENYLAHLADLTVLFVESPGSIAELGAFAASEALRPKTLAVLNTSYGSDKSFIADGPVRRIKNGDGNLVQYYTWDPAKLSSAETKAEFKDIVSALVAFLVNRDAVRLQQITFDPGRPGHTLFLVADLVRIAGAASRSDIADCLDALGCKSAHQSLDRHFSVLQSVDFITKHLRSNQAFYVRRSSQSFVRYAYDKGATLKNMARIQTTIRQSLDSLRKAVLRYSLTKGPADV